MAEKKTDALMLFKGKPLVRSGSTLYYGSMADKYVTLLQVLSTSEINNVQMSGNVSVQLLSTDPSRGPRERIIKKTEKLGLFNALNIANIWLMRYLDQ